MRHCLSYACAVVAEWLRRLTRNQFPSGSVGSNPTNCEFSNFYYNPLNSEALNSGWLHQFLDSLVVRISACHVEGPGSIPGRGDTFWLLKDQKIVLLQVRLELTTPA